MGLTSLFLILYCTTTYNVLGILIVGAAVDMYQCTVPPKSSFGSHFKVEDAAAPSSSHKSRFKYGPVTEMRIQSNLY